ncbi:type IV toxin-antitoxin system AbiEi family antitoxin domain-containing protein [Demequina phytophila]|uniref:type IV toxin-antitoxin system AbiEi family antitoxin domain-containing protein n=1 Tax=Demequina phytophila TaxID=1638981 RepID=UPI000A767B15|nr:type IV toxin-antitoxin system AbiEi family antitoxin [Demequina phytophila]
MHVNRPPLRDSPRARWTTLAGWRSRVPKGFPLFTTAELWRATDAPQAWLERHRVSGAIRTVAPGLHLVAPRDAEVDWAPDPVEVAWLLGARTFGAVWPYVSGISAAALHGVCEQWASEVHVTVPRQTRDRNLPGIATTVRFHQRDESHIGWPAWTREPARPARAGPVLDTMTGDLCTVRYTSRIQTALDLIHSPERSGVGESARDIAKALIQDLPVRDVAITASGQRRKSAYARLYGVRA